MIDKFRSDVAAAVSVIPSGATLAVGGFGSSGRPDTLLDVLCDLDRRDLHVIAGVTAHEAIPGHHMQIALEQEFPDRPRLRH